MDTVKRVNMRAPIVTAVALAVMLVVVKSRPSVLWGTWGLTLELVSVLVLLFHAFYWSTKLSVVGKAPDPARYAFAQWLLWAAITLILVGFVLQWVGNPVIIGKAPTAGSDETPSTVVWRVHNNVGIDPDLLDDKLKEIDTRLASIDGRFATLLSDYPDLRVVACKKGRACRCDNGFRPLQASDAAGAPLDGVFMVQTPDADGHPRSLMLCVSDVDRRVREQN